MNKFIQLVGIPASGKTTLAREISEGNENTIVMSSDQIREELFNSIDIKIQTKENHRKVFNIMYERTVDYLNQGYDVVYDATNIYRKDRVRLLDSLKKDVAFDIHKEVIYVQDSINNIFEKNSRRKIPVPDKVIDRMYKRNQIPLYSEGWNEITIHNSGFDKFNLEQDDIDYIRSAVFHGEFFDTVKLLSYHFIDFDRIYKLPHDSTYHSYSVSEHTNRVYRYTLSMLDDGDKDKELMLWASLLHDIGKYHCKSFLDNKGNERKYARFIGHELVGWQIAVDVLSKLYFDRDFIYKVATLVQFHMYLLDEKASRSKLVRYVGSDMYDKLDFLRKADTYAH